MIKNIDRKHTHLTLDNRIDIQQMLRDGFNFKMIANSLKKDPCTISKEVRKHIFVKGSTCTVKDKHGKEIKEICIKLTKPPYVCNACKKRTYCHMEKHLYDGKYAQNEYEKLLKESREGIPLTKESFYEVDKIISEGVRKGQHIYHIVQTKRGGRTKTWTHIRALKGVIYVFKRTEGKGAMYLSSDRICYRYGAPTWLSQQRTSVHMDS